MVSLAAFHGAEGSRGTARSASAVRTDGKASVLEAKGGGNLLVCPLGTTRRLQTAAGRSSASPRAGNVARTDASWLSWSWDGALGTQW